MPKVKSLTRTASAALKKAKPEHNNRSPQKKSASVNIPEIVGRFKTELQSAADPESREWMTKYMRNQFQFFGVKSPKLKAIFKEVLGDYPNFSFNDCHTFLRTLWTQQEREYQNIAITFAARNIKTLVGTCASEGLHSMDLAKFLITEKSWWDTVDLLASKVVGTLVLTHPETLVPVIENWNTHENLWLRRTSIIHQLDYKSQTNEERLFRFCSAQSQDPDFFIRKAIGWALRQYGRTNPEAVREFVHREKLSPLSTKEALKHIGS